MAAYEPQYQQSNQQAAYGNNPQPAYYNNQAYGSGSADAYGQQQAYTQSAYGQQPQYQQPPPSQPPAQQPYVEQPIAQPTPQTATAVTGGDYIEPGAVNFGDKDSDTNKCRDIGCAIFFLIQFFGMICLFGYYLNEYRVMDITYYNYSVRVTPGLVGLLLICFAIGAVIGLGFVCLIRKFPSKSIWFAGFAMVALYAGFGAWLLYKKAVLAGVLLLIFGCGFTLLFLFCVRKRIKFSGRLVKYSIAAIFKSWGVFVVAFANFIISGLYSIWWIVGSLSLICVEFQKQANAQGYDAANDAGGKYIGIWIGLAFPLFLTTETFQNIVHFTACGVTAVWWFAPDERSVTMASFKRASIWSLGTVVFGSTITSLLRTARFALRAFANDGSILAACAICILRCIENLVRFFNVYAFAWSATYGDDYCTSAKNTMKLLKAKGFEVIINDELVGMLLTMCALCCGALTAGIAGSIFYWAVNHKASVGPFFFAFYCGWIGSAMILQQIYSAVVASVVTWASAPEAMKANRPEAYEKLQKARSKFYK